MRFDEARFGNLWEGFIPWRIKALNYLLSLRKSVILFEELCFHFWMHTKIQSVGNGKTAELDSLLYLISLQFPLLKEWKSLH